MNDRDLFENIALPLHVLGFPKRQITEMVEKSLDEFVKEKSNQPGRVKGINLMIVNCSRGEKNINFVIFLILRD